MEDPLTTASILLDTTENLDRFTFGWLDYTLFGLLLLVSVFIGVYFGFFSKQDNTTEYLLGGKRMGCFPVAMSIIASHISGITLLGIPTEVFHHGTQYTACVITASVTAVVTCYVFLPVFYKLQLTSTFEYLEVRFARPVRILCSVLFTISLFTFLPIVIYVPALAFGQVSQLSVHTITPILCIVCIIYTSIGGLKAVVWTDTIQFSVTVGGLFTILVLGTLSIGSVGEVWRISGEGGRLIFFDMDPSPFSRNTFWGMSIGMTVTWLGHLGIHPGVVQRFLSVPREIDAKHTAITAVGMIIVKLICVFTGLIMFAKYYDCDPFLTKVISRTDQTLPYYVMDVAGHLPGLPGLFLAGLVSAALATMSASLNTVSGTIYEDFVRPWMPDGPKKEATATTVMKIIVVITGAISVGLVFLVERLGPVFQIAVSTRGITDGPLLGLFVMGMMVPWANTKGVLVGGYTSLMCMFWLVGGTQWYTMQGKIKHSSLPTSVDGCPYPWNETLSSTTAIPTSTISDEEPMTLFRISFIYYTMIGAVIVIVVGTIASYFFGMDLENVDPDHISPMMRRFLPPRKYVEVSLREVPPSHDAAGLEKTK
nr:PREDICTED: sodium-coupled monocarboxylate transporter 1-like isoform X2 [Linepithema humile]